MDAPMNPDRTSHAAASPTHTAWLAAQARQALALAQQAVTSMGVAADVAAEVGRGGGIELDGLVATFGVLPAPQERPGAAAPLIVTLSTRRPLGDVSFAEATALLSLAPTLVSFGACVGCDAHGHLCLFKLVTAEEVSAKGLEAALRHAWHLAKLVWAPAPALEGAA
jgi:hypothetical protein